MRCVICSRKRNMVRPDKAGNFRPFSGRQNIWLRTQTLFRSFSHSHSTDPYDNNPTVLHNTAAARR